MRTTSLFLHCTCSHLLYSYSAHAHNFSISAVCMLASSLFLECACAQLLYSCNAHAHIFSIPAVSMCTISRSCNVHALLTTPFIFPSMHANCSISFTCMRTNPFPSYISQALTISLFLQRASAQNLLISTARKCTHSFYSSFEHAHTTGQFLWRACSSNCYISLSVHKKKRRISLAHANAAAPFFQHANAHNCFPGFPFSHNCFISLECMLTQLLHSWVSLRTQLFYFLRAQAHTTAPFPDFLAHTTASFL